MGWHATHDPEVYADRAGPFLRSRPAEHTVPLTVTEVLRARRTDASGPAAPLLGWWEAPDGAVAGAFLLTPPHPLLLTGMPDEALAALPRVIAESGRALPAVNAVAAAASAFAAAWTERTGLRGVRRRGLRLQRLARLVAPDPPPPGSARVAGAGDRALLVAWYEAFGREIGEPGAAVGPQVDDRLTFGGLLLWEHAGAAVALAGMTRQVAGAVRIAPVYTPPEHRGRGFAAGATAAAARTALDAGAADVLLYTDVDNPRTNRLYARLGFVPVEERVVVAFGP